MLSCLSEDPETVQMFKPLDSYQVIHMIQLRGKYDPTIPVKITPRVWGLWQSLEGQEFIRTPWETPQLVTLKRGGAKRTEMASWVKLAKPTNEWWIETNNHRENSLVDDGTWGVREFDP